MDCLSEKGKYYYCRCITVDPALAAEKTGSKYGIDNHMSVKSGRDAGLPASQRDEVVPQRLLSNVTPRVNEHKIDPVESFFMDRPHSKVSIIKIKAIIVLSSALAVVYFQ